MEFLALPTEQAELLTAMNRERPLQVVAQFSTDKYISLEVSSELLLKILEEVGIDDKLGVRLHIRDALLPGDFVWKPHPNPRLEKQLDFVGSLCVQFWVSSFWDGWLLSGSTGLAGKGWYEDQGLDVSTPRYLKSLLERKLRKLCLHKAVLNVVDFLALIETGKRPPLVARASEGAMAYLQSGGRWRRRLSDLEYVPIPSPGEANG